jgi:hypothetical protein
MAGEDAGGLGGKFRPKTDEERAVGLGHNQGPPLDEPDPSGWRGRLLRGIKIAIGRLLRQSIRTAVVGLEIGAVAARIGAAATRIGVRAAEIGNPEVLIAMALAELAAQGLEAGAPYVRAYFDGPKSLEELQEGVKTPQPGYDIHHVVERNTAAPNGSEDALINAPDNLVSIPTVKHWELNRWYETPSLEFDKMTPRQYLKGKSWEERYRAGLVGLRAVGVLK